MRKELNNTGERVNYLMNELGLNRNTICQKTGISLASFSAKMGTYNESNNTAQVRKGFTYYELKKIASVLDCTVEYLEKGISDSYVVNKYGNEKIVHNPFVCLTDEEVDVDSSENEYEYIQYIERIVSNLFVLNPIFTTTAIEYLRRGQKQKVDDFLKELQKAGGKSK